MAKSPMRRVVADIVGKVSFNMTVPAPAPVRPHEGRGPAVSAAGDLGNEGGHEPPRPSHGPGYASVNWYGVEYTFTPKQRVVVAALWSAWESGELYVSESSLLDIADSAGERLRDLMKRHPAWGTMIVPGVISGGNPDTYQLLAPSV